MFCYDFLLICTSNSTNMNPEVSIVMPAFNVERFIADSINSVLSQDFADFELIIINDGSTDNTEDIVNQFNDPRIRYYRNDGNKGLFYTRNKGLELARGNYISMLDSDDIALPGKFSVQMEYLKNNPSIKLLGGGAFLIDGSGNKISGSYIQKAPSEAIPSILLFNNYFIQSTIIFARDILDKYTYRIEYPPSEDYDLWSRIALDFPTFNLNKPLILYRIHASSVSHTKRDVQIKGIKLIHKNQLNWLNIHPSDEELELHYGLANSTYSINDTDLKRVRSWLRKIYDANKILKVYDARWLNFVIYRMWFKFCLKNIKISPLKVAFGLFILPFWSYFRFFKY